MAETNQPGRLTWWGRARASSPRRPLPGVATEGPHRATAPADEQALTQISWQLVTGCKEAMLWGNDVGLCRWVLLGFWVEQFRPETLTPETNATNSLRRGKT